MHNDWHSAHGRLGEVTLPGPVDLWEVSMPAEGAGLYHRLALVAALEAVETAPAARATYTTALTGNNNDLTFIANTPGAGGNAITVRYVDPGAPGQSLSVSVDGTAITVNLATGGGGDITSTANAVRDAIHAHVGAKVLVSAVRAPGSSGAGVVTAMAAEELGGGYAETPGEVRVNVVGIDRHSVPTVYGSAVMDAPGARVREFEWPLMDELVIQVSATGYVTGQISLYGYDPRHAPSPAHRWAVS